VRGIQKHYKLSKERIVKFEEFNLNNNLLKAIADLGYVEPTEIQAKAIPLLSENDVDFVGQAQTGTGKTAAFVLPLLQKIDPDNKNIQALILAPTRELANQVRDEIVKLSKHTTIKSIAIYGGFSYEKQKRSLKKDRPQIVVGTPGRIMDLMDQGTLKFDQTNYMILDEADEMLNMGFFEDVQLILAAVNKKRRLWMFSATMPRPILNLIQKDFKNPEVVKIEKKSLSNEDIEQRYYVVRERNFKEAICRIIDSEPEMYGIVFCRTRQDTRDLADALLTRGYSVETLHGELGQNQRDAAMAKFKARRVNLMICTDVAARGIDVNNLSHVINYGAPHDLESYVHRTGRTGRAGMKGIAITLADPRQLSQMRRIESFIKQQIQLCKLPTIDQLKKSLVCKGLEKLNPTIEAIFEKGEDFKLDETFEIFKDRLDLLSREELEKLAFTWFFNKDLKRYRELGPIDEEVFSRKSGSRGVSPARQGGSFEKGRRSKARPMRAGSSRLFINIGKNDGLNLNTLLDKISQEVKVNRRDIQNVDLKAEFSFLDIPERYGQQLVSLKNVRINNKPVRLEFSQK